MQGLILAAGMGNRLGKYTKDNTKGMVEVNGVKMIDLSLERLYEAGIRKTILVVGYKAQNIRNYIGENYRDMKIVYIENEVYNKTNNIYSLWLAKDELVKEDTILLESDLVFEPRVLNTLVNCKYENSAVVAPFERWMDGTVTLVNDKNEITSFIPKTNFDWNGTKNYYKTVNIYKFSKNFSENTYVPFLEAYIKTLGDNEYYEQVLRVISHLDGIKIHANILSDEKWYEVDDAQDLDIAEVIFAKGKDKLNKLQNRYGGYWRFPRVKDFCYLVNPYFPTPTMLNEITYNFKTLTEEYPSGLNTQNLLGAKMFNLFDDNQILVGNGAAELIKSLASKIDGSFGIVFPSFNEYAERIGINKVVNFIPKNKNLEYTADDLIEFSEKIENLLLINPDNPSGSFIPEKEVLRLLDHLKKNGKKLIYDESFIDFAHKNDFFTLLNDDILNKYDNLFVVKSISKSYGVPGYRLGVLASSDNILLGDIRNDLSIWNINSFGEYFLQTIGKYKKDYVKACDNIRNERDRFYIELKKNIKIRVIPSQANYFTCEVLKGKSEDLAINLLDKHGIFIKDLKGKLGVNGEYVRLAVRNTEDNNLLLQALKDY